MTKTDIIETAFNVWGREFYLNTSLSRIASELKVCKPALYRHFRNKQTLLEAMAKHFFDDFIASIKTDYENALKTENKAEGIFMIVRGTTEYFAKNVNYFVFCMMNIYNREMQRISFVKEFKDRGLSLDFFQPLITRLIFATLIFHIAGFHKKEKSFVNTPGETEISNIINLICDITRKGLGYDKEVIDKLDYEKLESYIYKTVMIIEDDVLLKAVAGAVATAGPWEASMEQVARRSGLSKSSLYCHFKNKQDMLHQLFMTESMRIIDFARQGMRQSDIPHEQLYLGIYFIVQYLRSKPDILVAMDWIRTRKLDLGSKGEKHNEQIAENLRIFDEINIKPHHNNACPFNKRKVSPWIFFLILSTLMIKNPKQEMEEVPDIDIRSLFRFLALGIRSVTTDIPIRRED